MKQETTPQRLRRWADRARKQGGLVSFEAEKAEEIADELEGYRRLLRSMQRSMASHCGNIADALGATKFKSPEDC